MLVTDKSDTHHVSLNLLLCFISLYVTKIEINNKMVTVVKSVAFVFTKISKF